MQKDLLDLIFKMKTQKNPRKTLKIVEKSLKIHLFRWKFHWKEKSWRDPRGAKLRAPLKREVIYTRVCFLIHLLSPRKNIFRRKFLEIF